MTETPSTPSVRRPRRGGAFAIVLVLVAVLVLVGLAIVPVRMSSTTSGSINFAFPAPAIPTVCLNQTINSTGFLNVTFGFPTNYGNDLLVDPTNTSTSLTSTLVFGGTLNLTTALTGVYRFCVKDGYGTTVTFFGRYGDSRGVWPFDLRVTNAGVVPNVRCSYLWFNESGNFVFSWRSDSQGLASTNVSVSSSVLTPAWNVSSGAYFGGDTGPSTRVAITPGEYTLCSTGVQNAGRSESVSVYWNMTHSFSAPLL